MSFSEGYYESYQRLPEKLVTQYPELAFDNHCYLRIALDNAIGNKWDTVVKQPAYKNLTKENLESVRSLLKLYGANKGILFEHNQNSLKWRGKMT